MTSEQHLLTTQELARRLGVSDATVKEWARIGRIPAVRLSRKTIRFDYGAVVDAVRAADEQNRGRS